MRCILWALLPLWIATSCASPLAQEPQLTGAAWQLVKFEGGDGAVLTSQDPARYTLAFGADGRVSARVFCNRGSGTWKSDGPPHLEFGPLALTRMRCPADPLQARLLRDWPYMRAYVMKDGHLFLSPRADGGIYDFAPAPAP